jgi:hypothetical protein
LQKEAANVLQTSLSTTGSQSMSKPRGPLSDPVIPQTFFPGHTTSNYTETLSAIVATVIPYFQYSYEISFSVFLNSQFI